MSVSATHYLHWANLSSGLSRIKRLLLSQWAFKEWNRNLWDDWFCAVTSSLSKRLQMLYVIPALALLFSLCSLICSIWINSCFSSKIHTVYIVHTVITSCRAEKRGLFPAWIKPAVRVLFLAASLWLTYGSKDTVYKVCRRDSKPFRLFTNLGVVSRYQISGRREKANARLWWKLFSPKFTRRLIWRCWTVFCVWFLITIWPTIAMG